MFKLSICIPTYNRSKYLIELLDSIVAQDDPCIEVIVSDDTSPDDTVTAVAGYHDRFHHFTFVRQPVNLGLDQNFLTVVEAAKGDYVWLMGDDDRLEPGAIQAVLNALDRAPPLAGMTIGVIDYDPRMEHATGLRTMPHTQVLSGGAEVFGQIADLLGFMSALVIDRKLWKQVCLEDPIEDFMNYYIQVYIIGKVLERRPDWGVLNTLCVGYRSDNDQFLSSLGWLKRLGVDAVAYDEIARALFSKQPEAAHRMRRRIFDTHIIARIINAKTKSPTTPHIREAIKLLIWHYGGMPKLWYFAIPVLLMPNRMLQTARRIYQKHMSRSGHQRALKKQAL